MKALTLWQPWASLIAIGVKTIETRSWAAPKSLIGQRISIHAAKRPSDTEADFRFDPVLHEHGLCFTDLPLGAVVATARLVECVQVLKVRDDGTWTIVQRDYTGPVRGVVLDQLPYGDFTPGRWAWLLDDIEQLDKPLPATGRQGMWDIYI